MASTRTYGGEGTPVGEQSLGELVATLTRDVSLLVHQEVELAKTELAQQAKRAGISAGMFSGAGVIAVWGLFLLCFAAGFGIAAGAGIPIWAGFVCIGGLFVIVAVVLAVLGIGVVKKVGPPKRTMTSVKADLAWVKHPRRAPEASATEVS